MITVRGREVFFLGRVARDLAIEVMSSVYNTRIRRIRVAMPKEVRKGGGLHLDCEILRRLRLRSRCRLRSPSMVRFDRAGL